MDKLMREFKNGSRKSLNFHGLGLVITPNYGHTDFLNEYKKISEGANVECGVGGTFPKYVYKDKILWSSMCGEEEPGMKFEDMNECGQTFKIISSYLDSKTTVE